MRRIPAYILIILIIARLDPLTGCANIIPPGGGPRDSLPPILINVTPRDSTTNFAGGKIVLTFNEFVEVNNLQENLVVSPLPKILPVVDAHLRTITIRIKDTLEPNTTYSLNFGKAIRDINEGNELKNFRYIFSTGSTFDSLEFAGKVILAETGKYDSTLIVILHRRLDDSAVINERPRYFAKVDANGNFRFNNLPPETYAVYALEDAGGQKKYLSRTQTFGFIDQAVKVSENTPAVTIFAYKESKDTRATGTTATSTQNRTTDKVLRLSTNLDNTLLDLLNDLEITFGIPLKTFDTTKLRLTNEVFETIQGSKWTLDSTRKKATLDNAWIENRGYHLIFDKDFAEDSAGRKLVRNDTLTFRTRRATDYGSLNLRFINLDLTKHPVLQFVIGDQVRYSHVFTDRNVNIPLFAPGDYDLRLLYDSNQNGKWDPGEFFGKRRQPEIVLPLSRKINVKANWDNQIDITL